jgi:hypothetical protein
MHKTCFTQLGPALARKYWTRQKCLAVTNTVKPGTNGVCYKLKSFMSSFAGGGQNLSVRPWQKKSKKSLNLNPTQSPTENISFKTFFGKHPPKEGRLII